MDKYKKISKAIATETVFTSDEANVSDTVRINELLTEFVFEVEKIAEGIENEIIEKINNYFEELILEIKKNNITINLIAINRIRDNMKESIIGKIRGSISKDISMDNEMCRVILETQPGEIKEVSMSIFSKYSFYKAIREFKLETDQFINSNWTIIKENIELSINSIKEEIHILDEFLEELEIDEDEEIINKEILLNHSLEKIEVYNKILDLLN